MNRRARRRAGTFAIVLGAVIGTLGIGSAAEPDREEAARGAVMYRVYCSNCHGRGGKGDGKLATALRRPPADLTLIARRNGGVFDRAKVQETIDGRREVTEHGERDMPVWGLSFQREGDEEGREEAVQAKLADLVAYLETLQAPAEKPAKGSR